MSDRRTMSVDDVATELGVSTSNVYRMLRTNGRATRDRYVPIVHLPFAFLLSEPPTNK